MQCDALTPPDSLPPSASALAEPSPGRSVPVTESMRKRVRAYYRHPAVRSRMLEFLGGASLDEATALFIRSGDGGGEQAPAALAVGDLWGALDRDFEVSRSLGDRDGLIAHLDLEHVHFDRPLDTFERPERAFELQQPVVAAIEARLEAHGIPALHVLTGRGHHWTWKIPLGSPALAALAELASGPADPSGDLEVPHTRYGDPGVPPGQASDRCLGVAHHGLGQVLEGLVHDVLRDTQGRTAIPVQATAVIVGPGAQGREIVSLDVSEYGDPLWARTIRVPFSIYLKGWHAGLAAAPARTLEPLAVVPVGPGRDWRAALRNREPERAVELARRVSMVIPEAALGTHRLIESYRASAAAAFHRWYFATEPEPAERWPDTYDRLDLHALPACVRTILAQPNDLVLRPAGVQLLVRALVANGWHPRHVAGLVCSKLERDHGWRRPLHFVDARTRADFYVRLFAGLLLLGVDQMVDLNCVSTREKGMCPGSGCGWNLAEVRQRLYPGGFPWESGR